jgi:hypothetical protein
LSLNSSSPNYVIYFVYHKGSKKCQKRWRDAGRGIDPFLLYSVAKFLKVVVAAYYLYETKWNYNQLSGKKMTFSEYLTFTPYVSIYILIF